MNQYILSIIIPVHNVDNYISQCLDTLIPQIKKQCEVILVNDGSTDNSKSICEHYCSVYPNMKLKNQENKGLSGARNAGINSAKGDYLMFLDSDDFLSHDAIKTVLNTIKADKDDFYLIRSKSFEDGMNNFHENQVDYKNIRDVSVPIKAFQKLNSNNNFWFAAWLLIVKRLFIIENNLYFKEDLYHEDELWVPLIFANAKSMGLINKCLYCYRKNRKGSIIYQKNIKKQLDLITVLEELENETVRFSKEVNKVIKSRCAAIIWGRILEYHSFENQDKREFLYYEIKKKLDRLKYSKYVPLYYITKMFGIKRISKILNQLKMRKVAIWLFQK